MNPHPLKPGELLALRQELLDRHRRWQQAHGWIRKPTQAGIQSAILHPADGTISVVQAQSALACTADQLFDYLVTDIDRTCREWNDVMIYSGVIRELGEGCELSRIISEGRLLADREDVFVRCKLRLEDGTRLELSQGVGVAVEPVYTGISRYTQRSLMHFASKEIRPLPGPACHYQTIWHYDPAGWLSRLLPRKLLGNFILKNLIHEHQKLAGIFGRGAEQAE
ncbi:MAG: hypothetical protein D6722_05190 [Bacteroidetes bacterium]|nr:MAG: hypothetical protein D6722_05190 [Bacteroidota bacterium]